MKENVKNWKILLFLLLGLYVFLYVVASTVLDIYFLINDPVTGISYHQNEQDQVVISRVAPKGPAEKAGIQIDDIILEFHGKQIGTKRDLVNAYEDIEIGEKVDVKISRAGQEKWLSFTTERRLTVYTSSIFLRLLPGVAFCYALCLIGMFVLLKKLDDKTAHIFYLMVLMFALAMWGSFPFGSKSLFSFVPDSLKWIQLLHWPLAIGLLVHFSLMFPIIKKTFTKHRKLYLFIAYGPLLILAMVVFADARGFDWGYKVLYYCWGIWFPVNFGIAMRMLAHSCRTAPTAQMANQAKLIFWGTSFTLSLPTGIHFIPELLFDTQIPYSEYILLLVVLWPVVLAYAIIKHRFMDVNFIVKRGVAYALISGFVIAAYFLLIVGVGKLVLLVTGSRSQIVTIVATLLIAALFNPVKNRIQDFIERRFYPSRFTYKEAVRNFRHQLINVIDLQKLLDLVISFLSDTMGIRSIAVFWRHNPFSLRTAKGVEINSKLQFLKGDQVIKQLQKKQQLLDFSPLMEQLYFLNEEEKQRWESLQTELLLPLLSKGNLIGFISIGPKTNDEPFYHQDLDVLDALSDQINISLENALLSEELREQDRMKKELEVARKIQMSSLPQSDPSVPGLDISGVSIPATEVGGDYYDYLHLSDGRFGVVVGDVSGKGTSAALYMSQLRGILRTAARFHKSLKDLMVEVNSVAFNSIEEQYFITLTCGAFDLDGRKFNLVRAGHLPLIYYSSKSMRCEKLLPKGIGVGLEGGTVFKSELEETVIDIESGDVFLFYSDGLEEARNAAGEEFEANSLVKLVQENGYDSAHELRDKIISKVQTFTGDTSQFDDMTLVVVKVK